MKKTTLTPDFAIVGSGTAGLNAALEASRYGEVLLLTKSSLEMSSSYWAQGGIAAVLKQDDSFESHKKDTLNAGRGLCNTQAVDVLVKEGANLVQELIDQGIPFDRTKGALDLGLEGGHSHRRVLHANGAATGKALVEFLASKVKAQPNITILENTFVFKLLTNSDQCSGILAYAYNKQQMLRIQSPVTILATGGYSNLYQRSTNPHTSTGDGVWLGIDAGITLQDLEFVQFHPTAFYARDGSTFLISEAVRGEGAHLYNEDGERFMKDYPRKELSPRDVVAKEILQQIQQSKADCVYLDVRHLNTDQLRQHFPNLIARIEAQGIDISSQGVPVAPAAHYCIGGIATDLDARTSVEGLYACGEVASTGVHGANRLASNSLLECLVFSRRAVNHAKDNLDKERGNYSEPAFTIDSHAQKDFLQLKNKVATLLSTHVGIQREQDGLQDTMKKLEELMPDIATQDNGYYRLRSKGIVQLALALTSSALERKESRGVHTRTDFPQKVSPPRHIRLDSTPSL